MADEAGAGPAPVRPARGPTHPTLLQTAPDLARLPVLFISGYGRDETIARALEAGARRARVGC